MPAFAECTAQFSAGVNSSFNNLRLSTVLLPRISLGQPPFLGVWSIKQRLHGVDSGLLSLWQIKADLIGKYTTLHRK